MIRIQSLEYKEWKKRVAVRDGWMVCATVIMHGVIKPRKEKSKKKLKSGLIIELTK